MRLTSNSLQGPGQTNLLDRPGGNMGDSKSEGHLRHVRRLNQEASGVVTINIRSSWILVFWSSIDLIVPIDPGCRFRMPLPS